MQDRLPVQAAFTVHAWVAAVPISCEPCGGSIQPGAVASAALHYQALPHSDAHPQSSMQPSVNAAIGWHSIEHACSDNVVMCPCACHMACTGMAASAAACVCTCNVASSIMLLPTLLKRLAGGSCRIDVASHVVRSSLCAALHFGCTMHTMSRLHIAIWNRLLLGSHSGATHIVIDAWCIFLLPPIIRL